MKRKIIIEKCGECLYCEHIGMTPDENGKFSDVYSCENPENGNSPEDVKEDTLPDWCLLEKDC